MDEIFKDFLIESNENLDRLDQEVVRLEYDPPSKKPSAAWRSLVIHRFAAFLLVFMFLSAPDAWSQSAENTPDTYRISGSGLKSESYRLIKALARHGVSFRGLLVQDWSKEWDQDSDNESGYARYSLDLTLAIDGQKLLNWKGAAASIGLKQHIREFGEGDELLEQLYSNIDGPNRTTLYELWLEQKIFAEKLRFKIGKFDSNTEFAFVEGAGNFLNSSMGFSPTILNFPTYPEPKPGIGLFLRAIKNYELRLGVFQSAGSGLFSVMEPGRRWSTKNDLPGRLSIGYWRRDGTIRGFAGTELSATQGVYSVFEQVLWRQSLKAHGGERALSTFFQAGQADSRMTAMSGHVGGGMVLQALFPRRPQDCLGVGVTWVRISGPGTEFNADEELVQETFYKAALTKNLVFEQDFQYLHDPKGKALSSGPVLTSRLIFAF